MLPVTLPVFICGLLTCLLVEKFKLFGYGETLPDAVRAVLQEYDTRSRQKRTRQETLKLVVQAIIGIWLIIALALHGGGRANWSDGDYFATALTGVTDEHAIGKAFTESLPLLPC